MVEELQWTIEKKEEEHENVGRREKKARKHIEEENDVLRRKAALGWMLGCLSGTHQHTTLERFELRLILKLGRCFESLLAY